MAKVKADVGAYKKITQGDFEKLQLRAGTIVQVKKHPTLAKDYVILVDTSAADEDIQVVAELVDSYSMAELLGKQVVVLCNVAPEMVGGEESQGMILVTHIKKKSVLIGPHKQTPPGTPVGGLMNSYFAHFNEREHTHR